MLLPELMLSARKANNIPIRARIGVNHDEATRAISVHVPNSRSTDLDDPCVVFGEGDGVRGGETIRIAQYLKSGAPEPDPVAVRPAWDMERVACQIEVPLPNGPVAVTVGQLVAWSLDELFFGAA